LDSKPPLDIGNQRKSLGDISQKNIVPETSILGGNQRSTTPSRGDSIDSNSEGVIIIILR
jgi:hypothetical protein